MAPRTAAPGTREDQPGELHGQVVKGGEPDGRDAAMTGRQPNGEEPPGDGTGEVQHGAGNGDHAYAECAPASSSSGPLSSGTVLAPDHAA